MESYIRKKFLNENLVLLDTRLLKNFYLNNGYYKAEVNYSFAKLINDNEFELIFSIDAKNRYYFGNIDLNIPSDFNSQNFIKLEKLFSKLKGKPYSINDIDKILKEIDKITLLDEFKFVKAKVIENLSDNIINLKFNLTDTEKIYVKINIFGNTITNENVIRNQLEFNEGDPFSEI